MVQQYANKNKVDETKVTSSATVGTPQKIEPIRAPSFSVSYVVKRELINILYAAGDQTPP
jgi:hypothetical protein